jgi:SAM-dependent methyltransferase
MAASRTMRANPRNRAAGPSVSEDAPGLAGSGIDCMNGSDNDELIEARQWLSHLMVGGFVTQSIYVVAKLGIPDLLHQRARTAAELAAATGSDLRALQAILRAATALGLFALDSDGRLQLRPMGRVLRSYPGWRAQALLFGEEYYRACDELLGAVKAGRPAFDKVFGMSLYEYLADNRAAASSFNEVMTLSAPSRYGDVPSAYDFARVRTLVDVGAGHGALTAMILRAYPQMRAILMDSRRAIAGARRYLEQQGLLERCELVPGDFFESVPAGGDAYLMSSVVINWDDERALRLLRNCRRAMAPGAALLIIEHVFVDGRPPSLLAAVASVAGFAIQGAVTRSEQEYRALLGHAGFEIVQVRQLDYESYAIIHARPV